MNTNTHISLNEYGFDLSVSRSHQLIHECYELRHQVFAEELKWVDTNTDQQEVDQFDLSSSHIVASMEGSVKGYMRITPENNRWLLTEVFPFLIENYEEHQFLDNSVEVTRLAVDQAFRGNKEHNNFSMLDMLIKGLLQYSLKSECKHWYIVVSEQVFRLLNKKGLNCVPLGPVVKMPDGVRTLAARIDVDEFVSNCDEYFLNVPGYTERKVA